MLKRSSLVWMGLIVLGSGPVVTRSSVRALPQSGVSSVGETIVGTPSAVEGQSSEERSLSRSRSHAPLNPDSVYVELFPDDSVDAPLFIYNPGTGPLDFGIDIFTLAGKADGSLEPLVEPVVSQSVINDLNASARDTRHLNLKSPAPSGSKAFGDIIKQFNAPWGEQYAGAGLSYDPNTGFIWAVNQQSQTMYEIDPVAEVVISSWAIPLGLPWGCGFDGTELWVSDATVTNDDYEFAVDGTGPLDQFTPIHTYWAADMAWDGQWLWQIDVGSPGAVYAYDFDGNPQDTIQPGYTISQRGLAYNMAQGTWYCGSWNAPTGQLWEFDDTGATVNCVVTGLAIAGLAWDYVTGDIWCIANSAQDVIYELDSGNLIRLVTGGGWIPGGTSGAGTKRTFGFNAQSQTGPTVAQLQFVDHATKLKVHSDTVKALVIHEGDTVADFSGDCRVCEHGGQLFLYTFECRVMDRGEPGRGVDWFSLDVYDGDGNLCYSAGDYLGGGNIQIHRPDSGYVKGGAGPDAETGDEHSPPQAGDVLTMGHAPPDKWPSAFTDGTTITFHLPSSGHATLEIYDITGRLVATPIDRQLNSGPHTATWNTDGPASGIYFYRLTAGESSAVGKVLLLR